MGKQLYILYDERAYQDTADAVVYCTADTLAEARRDKRQMFPDAAIFVYDIDTDGKTLINELLVE